MDTVAAGASKINLARPAHKELIINQYAPVKHAGTGQQVRDVAFQISGLPALQRSNGLNVIARVFWKPVIVGSGTMGVIRRRFPRIRMQLSAVSWTTRSGGGKARRLKVPLRVSESRNHGGRLKRGFRNCFAGGILDLALMSSLVRRQVGPEAGWQTLPVEKVMPVSRSIVKIGPRHAAVDTARIHAGRHQAALRIRLQCKNRRHPRTRLPENLIRKLLHRETPSPPKARHPRHAGLHTSLPLPRGGSGEAVCQLGLFRCKRLA